MKSILITGSTDGIGKLVALKLAKDGHEVILHGRNADKLKSTLSEIQSQSQNNHVKSYLADLSNFESIRKMTEDLFKDLSKLDVLINNAGVFKSPIDKNQDQLDLRFAVNYFAPYLLTHQLLTLLQNSSSPRVINLSSAAQASFSIDDLQGNTKLTAQQSYAQSKLALTMWSTYLSKKYDYLNVIAVNPGSLLNTKMVQEAYGQFWSSADKGANILYDLAVSDEHADKSGQYFDNDKGSFSKAHSDAYDDKKIKELIHSTNKILNL